MKKLTTLILSLSLVGTTLATASCGGSSEIVDYTEIEIVNFDGGLGHDWVDPLIAKFEDMYKDYSFEPGKTGVKVNATNTMSIGKNEIETSGYNIYFASFTEGFQTAIQQGLFLNIDDAVKEVNTDGKTIESKLDPVGRNQWKGNDGNYYVLPFYEFYPGASYDVDLFEEENFYLAAPEETDVMPYRCEYGTANFVASTEGKKSCGNDGKYGTYDDGLPTTLQDFLILCSKMYSVGVTPFLVAGSPIRYTNYFTQGLWASLAGVEAMKVNYSFDGEINHVTGYNRGVSALPGMDTIAEPIYEKLTINDSNYDKDLHDTLERYYALAFMEIATENKWIATKSPSATHIDTMEVFVENSMSENTTYGMIMEGSYWYTQARTEGKIDAYLNRNKDKTERNVAWMSLPTAIKQEDAVTSEADARTVALMETGLAGCFINNNIADDEGLVDACKKFVQLFYSDEGLSAYTRYTGGGVAAMKYELLQADYNALCTFQKTLWNLRKDGGVVFALSDNPNFLANLGSYMLGDFNKVFWPSFGAGKSYDNYFSVLRAANDDYSNTIAIFEKTSLKNR